MNYQALISIILPVYNGQQYLAKTIESVLAQFYRNFELLIINDGSSDQSKAVVEFYLKDSRLRYVEQKNAGVANARNTGIKLAKGEFISLIDQDDIWLPHKLEHQVNYLTQHPACALVHSQIQFINGKDEVLVTPNWAWVSETYDDSLNKLFQHNCIATFTVLIRKSALDNVGIFREVFAPSDDWDLWLRIACKYELGYVSENCGYYRIHDNNESKNQSRMQLAEVNVVENFIQEFKSAQRMIPPQLQKKKCFEIYCETALFFEQSKQYSMASNFWLKALKLNYLSVKCYNNLFWGLFPKQLRTTIHWYSSRLKGLFH